MGGVAVEGDLDSDDDSDGEVRAAGRATGREEPRRKAASTRSGGEPRSPRDGRDGGVAVLRRSPSRRGDGVRSEVLGL